MIICTKCGSPNPDDARLCAGCGNKLQSGRQAREEREGGLRPSDIDGLRLRPNTLRRGAVAKCFEAWGYALAAVAVSVYAVVTADLRPAWVGLPVIALVAFLRKV